MKEFKDIPKENPFRVPENYFAGLEGRIMDSVNGAEKVPSQRGIVRRLLPYLAVAASIALLALIGYNLFYPGTERQANNRMTEVAIGDLTDPYLNDIDLYTLEEKVAESGIRPERTGASRAEIIDYLVNENIDEFDIYENL